MRRAGCLVVLVGALAGAQPALGIEKVTIAARVCPSYSAITANEARNNIQETLRPLGADTPYKPNDAMDPQTEADSQPLCTALAGWHFTLGTGIGGAKSVGVWGSLSVVSGAYDQSIVTLASTPLLDTNGVSTGTRTSSASPTTSSRPRRAGRSSCASDSRFPRAAASRQPRTCASPGTSPTSRTRASPRTPPRTSSRSRAASPTRPSRQDR